MNPLKADPQQSHFLRKRFVGAVNKRFRKLRGLVEKLVYDENAFGLKSGQGGLVFNTRYAFQSDARKIESFRNWLQEQIEEGLLESVGPKDEPWLAEFIESSYKKGMVRSYTDANKEKLSGKSDVYAGTKEDFVRGVVNTRQSMQRVELLYTRAYESFHGVTQQMATSMSRVMADAISNGYGARHTARNLKKEVGLGNKRALTVARTELSHSYAEGQLDAFEKLGVDRLGIMAEWLTAGDDRVCPLCLAQAGTIFTVTEARLVIPLHPNCRCAWIPYLGEPKR